MNARRRTTSLFLISALLCGIIGCAEEEPTLAVAIRARTQIKVLYVHVKQYHDEERVTIHPARDFQIPEEDDGYLVTVNEKPLRLRVELPEPGRYAVHLVGVPVGVVAADPTSDRHIATICRDVTGVVAVDDVVLGRLTRGSDSADVDGDTFPESLDTFCALQAAAGMPCDTTCNSNEYLAMLDCNPAADYEVPEGCGTIEGPEHWNPFATDSCGDCLDQDCYGGDARCIDFDGDGYPENLDCNDRDPGINPGVEEICGNGIDENCTIDIEACTNGDVPCDHDGDGFLELQEEMPGCGLDCDDTSPSINPDQYEGLGSNPENPMDRVNCDDGIDNNCDGRIDERCESDLDDDGVELDIDCNDCNAAIGPGFPEVCGDGVDEDCDGLDLTCSSNDSDGDGYDAMPIGNDCDDDDAHTYTGAPERCGDDIAQNCNLARECVDDADGDLFDEDDCDDSNADVNPWAVERCDNDGGVGIGLDDDCDGQINEVPWELDALQGCGLETIDEGWQIIDYTTDVDHCGGCRHACWLGSTYREGDHCEEGLCLCFDLGYGCGGDVTDICCEDGCQDISVDPRHCGSCTNACVPFGEELCTPTGLGGRGECHCPHEPDQRRCDAVFLNENACCPEIGCTNINNDVHNCGGCGIDCEANLEPGPRGDICAANASGDPTCFCGSVGVVCTGSTWCTGVGPDHAGEGSCGCRDLSTDRESCGTCELACDENEDCVEGSCFCTSADMDCNGDETSFCCPNASTCVDLTTDVQHCGDCFATPCRPGETCEDGRCRCDGFAACGPNRVCCSGQGCTYVLSDEDNCGPLTDTSGCGRSCQNGVECVDGFCSCGAGGDCAPGTICCFDTYCANIETDPDNCGYCGIECRVGEECVDGSCTCGADCDDGNACTEDPCLGGRCEHHTLDHDNDGYCASGCRDQDSGEPGDCINGDCDDDNVNANPGRVEDCNTSFDDDCDGSTNDRDANNCTLFYQDIDDDAYGDDDVAPRCQCWPSGDFTASLDGDCDDALPEINPGLPDICNGIDDDCNDTTADGSADCAGGPSFCCGSPRACRECCTNSQCPGFHNRCTGYVCTCESGWEDCEGACDCNTGDDQVCCGTMCLDGSCCSDSDCGGLTPNCCGNSCEECCDAADCGPGSWLCQDNHCQCYGIVCPPECWDPGECCDNDDCPGGDCRPDHICNDK